MTRFVLPALMSIAFVLGPAVASASPLEDAKRDGLVGERYDGYLGAVLPNPPANVKQLIASINGERKTEYAAIAKKNGISVEQVALLAGKKLVGRASAGEYVMGSNGKWVRAP